MTMTEMGLLKLTNRPEWANRVKDAMRRNSGRVAETALSLGVTTRTLFRWLNEPEFSGVRRAPVGIRRDRKAVT